ncbi:hypothetical protein II810_02640 [bacterium]|nr:hypothetical protein [bacterium]
MKELIKFFKDLFMITDENSKTKVGLAQFNRELKVQQPVNKVTNIKKEVKLSDLMRKSA